VAQLLVFGAKVLLVDGTYDDAFDLTVKAADEFWLVLPQYGLQPVYAGRQKNSRLRNLGIYVEQPGHGVAQVDRGTVPLNRPRLTIFVSVGDGNIISGIHKGFKDLQLLGWLDHMPRIIGVQAEGSAAITNAFRAGNEQIVPVSATPLADSISVDLPRDGVRAVRAAAKPMGRISP
jgi:threonine synthase